VSCPESGRTSLFPRPAKLNDPCCSSPTRGASKFGRVTKISILLSVIHRPRPSPNWRGRPSLHYNSKPSHPSPALLHDRLTPPVPSSPYTDFSCLATTIATPVNMTTRRQRANSPEFPILDANALYASTIRGDGELKPRFLHVSPLTQPKATACSTPSPTSCVATRGCTRRCGQPL